ncbi:hypothetical protein BVG79_00846 [Ketogulonicigenium robustum]|uniref:Uncharacterized protein n=1 Tax=Ketogulonicigenium robustum TaxID=92947 RepID=A0A1W6NY74_9RHOB|nr:hypothetical protein [Ketogulonicigenium robustum]ARO14198.1 hypothetical protein BVG79_00846 [Ketogulonicigenium robustum]
MLWKFIKVIIFLAVLAVIALIAYAYLGPLVTPADFQPPAREIRTPVTLP